LLGPSSIGKSEFLAFLGTIYRSFVLENRGSFKLSGTRCLKERGPTLLRPECDCDLIIADDAALSDLGELQFLKNALDGLGVVVEEKQNKAVLVGVGKPFIAAVNSLDDVFKLIARQASLG
jgi:hypothetical protein